MVTGSWVPARGHPVLRVLGFPLGVQAPSAAAGRHRGRAGEGEQPPISAQLRGSYIHTYTWEAAGPGKTLQAEFTGWG